MNITYYIILPPPLAYDLYIFHVFLVISLGFKIYNFIFLISEVLPSNDIELHLFYEDLKTGLQMS